MLSQLSVIALAAASLANAGPLAPRQASSTAVSIATAPASAASSVIMSASSAISSALVSASSGASSASMSGSSMMMSGSSMMPSSSAAISSAAMNVTTGNQSYPAYPCPAGYLLTYVTENVTLPIPITEVKSAFGLWANSSYFPNVTAHNSTGVNSTHTISLMGIDIMEMLVNSTMNATSEYMQYTWNLTNGPLSVNGVSISNYSTVLSIYSPSFESTGMVGNSTTLLTYSNICGSNQAATQQLVTALSGLELQTFSQKLAASAMNGTSTATSSMAAGASSTVMSASSMASSSAMSASSMASSAASGATSAAASGTSAAASEASSVAQAVSSAAGSAVSAASSAARA